MGSSDSREVPSVYPSLSSKHVSMAISVTTREVGAASDVVDSVVVAEVVETRRAKLRAVVASAYFWDAVALKLCTCLRACMTDDED